MANNYYEATGVLVLDRVTPVIQALFGAFALDESHPGNGQAYIAQIAETTNPQWPDVLDGLEDLATQLGIPMPDDEGLSIPPLLELLAVHFRADEDEELGNLIDRHSFEDTADLDALFLIATRFDDGHHLTAIQFEGCWYCSKPRLFEFGGNGCYLTRGIRHGVPAVPAACTTGPSSHRMEAFLILPHRRFHPCHCDSKALTCAPC